MVYLDNKIFKINNNECSDQQIVDGILKGELEFENRFYLKYQEQLSYYTYWLCKDKILANDLMQDAVVITLFRLRKGKLIIGQEGHLLNSMKTIVKNIWRNRCRKKEITHRLSYNDDIFSSLTHEDVEQLPLHDVAQIALASLDKKCHELIIMFYFKKTKHKQIVSTDKNIKSEGYSRNAKWRCMKKLKNLAQKELIKYVN